MAATKNYIVYTKLDSQAHKVITIKATEYSIIDSGKFVKFSDGTAGVAIFNIAELVGFVQEDHIAN